MHVKNQGLASVLLCNHPCNCREPVMAHYNVKVLLPRNLVCELVRREEVVCENIREKLQAVTPPLYLLVNECRQHRSCIRNQWPVHSYIVQILLPRKLIPIIHCENNKPVPHLVKLL